MEVLLGLSGLNWELIFTHVKFGWWVMLTSRVRGETQVGGINTEGVDTENHEIE